MLSISVGWTCSWQRLAQHPQYAASYPCCVVQIQDYLINIKANRGSTVKTLMCSMIQLLLILDDTDYARAVILHVRTMLYHEQTPALPFHGMFTQDVGTFSEEPGEIAISVTARYTLGDHTNDKLAHVNKMYQSIGLYHNLCSRDEQLRDENCSDHNLPDLESTLASTTEYFRGVLRSLRAGTWVYYANADAYEVNGHAHRLLREPPNLLWRDIKSEIPARLTSIERTFPRHWGAQFADIMEFVLPERGIVEQPVEDPIGGGVKEDALQERLTPRASENTNFRRSRQRAGRRRRSVSPSSPRVPARSLSESKSEDESEQSSEYKDPGSRTQNTARSHRALVTPVPAPTLGPDGAESPSGFSQNRFEVGSSYESAFVQTALHVRPRRGRRRRLADRGPFLQSPTV